MRRINNPQKILEADLKAHIDIKTDSGEHIEIIYRGNLSVLYSRSVTPMSINHPRPARGAGRAGRR